MDSRDNSTLDVQSSYGFVNTVQLKNTGGGPPASTPLWSKSTSISFILFMVIGFCATLAAIGICVGAFLLCRNHRRRRSLQRARDLEAATTIPEPKELFVVVHPGGHADVAHKDLDETPRKLILSKTPIQLSAATIDQEKNSPPMVHLTASASPLQPQSGGPERIWRLQRDPSGVQSPKIMAGHASASASSANDADNDGTGKEDPAT